MKTTCFLCSTRMRAHCPALDAPICGPCCGSKRNISIKCTADCRFNPFAPSNYDTWLNIDEKLNYKMIGYVERSYDLAAFNAVVNEMSYDDSEHGQLIGSVAATYYLLFQKRNPDSRTLAEVWRDNGWEGLTTDEQCIMGSRLNARVAILEVQKVLDRQGMECVDLLAPEKGAFIVFDRNTAARIARFTRLWTWIADYTYYSRPVNALGVSENALRGLMAQIQKDTQNARKQNKNNASRDEMLAANFGRYSRLIFDEDAKARQRMLESMDFHLCRAFYAIKGARSKVKDVLDSKLDFRLAPDAKPEKGIGEALVYDWMRIGGSKALEASMPSSFQHEEGDPEVGMIGRIYLTDTECVVEVMSRLKFKFTKEIVKEYWGDLLEFRREAVIDIAKQMAKKTEDDLSMDQEPKSPQRQTTIPREVEEQLIKEHYRKHYTKFLDDAVPMLDGMTPRKAAKSAQMRPHLVELMKNHLHMVDRTNKERGFSINIEWVLDELGLTDLK